ncbi:hypothetical protein NA63_0006 [Flavobacteriaceae bacterium MAR_2010_105]|nr:hypothetical protein NA63_0006 [Flavobacteriaceae bacterium MAR_2010_105]
MGKVLGQHISKDDYLTNIIRDNYPSTSKCYLELWIENAVTGVGSVGFTKIIN